MKTKTVCLVYGTFCPCSKAKREHCKAVADQYFDQSKRDDQGYYL